MADSANIDPVHVAAEERVHPAMRRLARALIDLVRSKQAEEPSGTEIPDEPKPRPNDAEIGHD